MAQDAVNRWYAPALMMFGPPDDDSPNSKQSMAWNIKRFSNDELRNRFVGMMVEQVKVLELTLPDKDIRFNEETKKWEHGPLTGMSSTRSSPAAAPATPSAWNGAAKHTRTAPGCAKPPPPTPTKQSRKQAEKESAA